MVNKTDKPEFWESAFNEKQEPVKIHNDDWSQKVFKLA